MLDENIRRFRKSKGLTQEELASSLNVVRQTVSKWETGLSVPDADILPQLAILLGVSVNQLLGTEQSEQTDSLLAQKLKETADELVEKERLENLSRSAGRKRGFILLFSFFALLASATIQNKPLSILIVSLCILAAMVVFVRNLALLSNVSATNPGFIIIKIVTFFNLAILGIAFVVAILTSLNILSFSAHSEKLLAGILISCVMVFAGAVSSKLPFNRHTGLRLPWTVQDEGTWNVAHRILG